MATSGCRCGFVRHCNAAALVRLHRLGCKAGGLARVLPCYCTAAHQLCTLWQHGIGVNSLNLKLSSCLQGDNFANSTDSRHYGAVPYALLRGRVFLKVGAAGSVV